MPVAAANSRRHDLDDYAVCLGSWIRNILELLPNKYLVITQIFSFTRGHALAAWSFTLVATMGRYFHKGVTKNVNLPGARPEHPACKDWGHDKE